MTARARLRAAAEHSRGQRVIVDRAALLELLADAGHAPAVLPAQRVEDATPAPGGQVTMGTTTEDAVRLARAAWDTCSIRVERHGGWDDADPALTWATVEAARLTLQVLAGVAPAPVVSVGERLAELRRQQAEQAADAPF